MTRTVLGWQREWLPRVCVVFGAKMRKGREWRSKSSAWRMRRIKINRLSYLRIMGGRSKISILV